MRTLLVALILSSLAMAGQHAPLPPAFTSAKTAYIDGQVASRIRDKAYEELKKWGRFAVVDTPEKADIIFSISSEPSPSGVYSVSLTVGDAHSRNILWSDQRPWRGFHASEDGAGVSGIESIIKELRKRMDDK